MLVPNIQGVIDRRILANYIADSEVVARFLPYPFRPKLHDGHAVVGVCLIRLTGIRIKGFPSIFGITSENGAHRIAVEWTESGKVHEGVYIPRRDTSAWFNVLAGGRFFPGRHHHASFDVRESGSNIHVAFSSSDGTQVRVDGSMAEDLGSSSAFRSLDEASSFFEAGSLGCSPNGKSFDMIRLSVKEWRVHPLRVSDEYSSFFKDEKVFPKGSVRFDHALLMRHVPHEWNSVPAEHPPR